MHLEGDHQLHSHPKADPCAHSDFAKAKGEIIKLLSPGPRAYPDRISSLYNGPDNVFTKITNRWTNTGQLNVGVRQDVLQQVDDMLDQDLAEIEDKGRMQLENFNRLHAPTLFGHSSSKGSLASSCCNQKITDTEANR